MRLRWKPGSKRDVWRRPTLKKVTGRLWTSGCRHSIDFNPATMSMLPFFDEDHLALRGRVRTWAEKNLTSLSAEPNDVEEMGRRLVRQIGREGFLTYTVPKDYAG